MSKSHIIFRGIRKIMRENPYTTEYVNFYNQEANDYIADKIANTDGGLMISKFGTIELDNLVCFQINKNHIGFKEVYNALKGRYSIHTDEAMHKLCNNAGFFPFDETLLPKYYKLVCQDAGEIDILGSYLKEEKYFRDKLKKDCICVNLNGFYAPFMWKNPWTKELKGKNVLVVHPFIESINKQYQKRKVLFENQEVLPEFNNLFCIKAVQSIAGNNKKLPYKNWFEALDDMKREMDKLEYDVAIIGCGAYGMNLAAHAKRKGKVAIHLAGWTQMLFGIYGNRWINDQPEFKKYINEYWVRPEETEIPDGAKTVENGCYW